MGNDVAGDSPVDMRRVLVLVAHPDDETIFFGGLVQRLVALGVEVDIVSATCGRDLVRKSEFLQACRRLRANPLMLPFPGDVEGAMSKDSVIEALSSKLDRNERLLYSKVYTHGPWGEYGHADHINVACAAAHLFEERCMYLSTFLPDETLYVLTQEECMVKEQIMATVYLSQPKVKTWWTDAEGYSSITGEVLRFLAELYVNGHEDMLSNMKLSWGPLHQDFYAKVAAAFKGECIPPNISKIPQGVWRCRLTPAAERLMALVGED